MPQPSLDTVEAAAQRGLESQIDQIKGFDTKGGLILGSAGVILAVLAGLLGNEDLGSPELVLLAISVCAIGISVILAVLSLWPQPVDVPPNPEHLFNSYLSKPAAFTRHKIVQSQVEAYRKNAPILSKKLNSWKASAVALVAGLMVLIVFVLYNQL